MRASRGGRDARFPRQKVYTKHLRQIKSRVGGTTKEHKFQEHNKGLQIKQVHYYKKRPYHVPVSSKE